MLCNTHLVEPIYYDTNGQIYTKTHTLTNTHTSSLTYTPLTHPQPHIVRHYYIRMENVSKLCEIGMHTALLSHCLDTVSSDCVNLSVVDYDSTFPPSETPHI
eukprot:GHVQ01035466.1.p1 GENE.GHVQ01035466.1~~GHVQ01035466.1.p1  ORF type:complete len:102 (+),score=15.64 GHVQ01035466.1:367-672(+)